MKKVKSSQKPISFQKILQLTQYYLDYGLAIAPTNKEKKIPLSVNDGYVNSEGKGGVYIASNDRSTVTALFNAVKGSAWGIAVHCGESGLIVLDFDEYKEDYSKEAKELIDQLPNTVTSITPGGGKHLWFKYPENSPYPLGNNTGNLPKGIDVRGLGGFIVLPGSYSYKGEYQWKEGKALHDLTPAALPENILNELIAANHYEKETDLDFDGEGYTPEDIEAALEKQEITYEIRPYGLDAIKYRLDYCPNSEAHEKGTDGAAIFLQIDGPEKGKIGFKCHHNHCLDLNWQSIKDKILPTVKTSSLDLDITLDVNFDGLDKLFLNKDKDPNVIAKQYPYVPSLASILDEEQKPIKKDLFDTYYELNQLGDAQIIYNLVGDYLLWDVSFQKPLLGWYAWNGQRWELLNTKILTTVAKVLSPQFEMRLEKHRKKLTKTVESSLELEADIAGTFLSSEEKGKRKKELKKLKNKHKKAENVIRGLKKRKDRANSANGTGEIIKLLTSFIQTTGNDWDDNPYLLPVQNGVIDLQQGIFRNSQPIDLITKFAPVEWKGLEEPAERWEKFLIEIFDNDKELIHFIHKLLGYAISGLSIEPIFPVLYGVGRNGKSVLVEVLGGILGGNVKGNPIVLDEEGKPIRKQNELGNGLAGAIDSSLIANKGRQLNSSGGATPHLAELQGKRIVFSSELEMNEALKVATVKQLTGGDTIVARPLFKNPIRFNPTHTIFLLTNHKPKVPADDQAIWDRIALIPFNQRFVDDPEPGEKKADKFLIQKLLAESSGILAWLVNGFLLWQKEGLNIPDSVKAESAKYRSENDLYSDFFEEMLDEELGSELNVSRLFNIYLIWAKEQGFQHTITERTLKKKIKSSFPLLKETNQKPDNEWIDPIRNKKGKQFRFLVNLTLTDAAKSYELNI